MLYDLIHYRSMDYLIDGQTIHFSETERAFFAALFNARGTWVLHKQLESVMPRWDEDPPLMMKDIVKQNINTLRKKLSNTRFRILNYAGHGYRFDRLK